MRGCSDLSGRTNSNLNPSCPSESSSGVNSSSTTADNNILSALGTYTDASSCSCSDFDSVCVHSSDSGFHVSVTNSSNVLSSDSNLLTIQGTNFAERESDNQVTLTSSVGDAVKASVYTSTEDTIVLEFHQLSQLNGGASLSAEVTSTISSSGTSSGSYVEVAKIVAANPSVMSSSDTLSSDSARITIQGTGFDAMRTTDNSVTLSSSGSDTPSGQVIQSTMSTLEVTFTHLSPSESGVLLSAEVVIHNTWSSSSVDVATVIDVSSATTETVAGTTETDAGTTETVAATTDATTDDDDSGDESSSSSDDTTVIAVSATIGGVIAILLIVAVYYSMCGSSAKKTSSLQSSARPRHAIEKGDSSVHEL